MKPNFIFTDVQRPRTGFHASDYGKLEADIILHLQGVAPTNPRAWSDTLRMAAGKGVELQMVDILKENGIVAQSFSQDECEPLVVERHGVQVTCHYDAVVKEGGAVLKGTDALLPNGVEIELGEGEPIEIKSVNNKNSFDIQKYIDGKPRESYVGQLAQYMDAMDRTRGHLFVSSVDGLHTFWFVCIKNAETGLYHCGNTVVDLAKEHGRWAEIWRKHQSGEEPNWLEETYKTPIGEVKWTELSSSRVSEARNGRYVVGSEGKWRIDYSPYKNLIIERQGASPGYSPAELEQIKLITAGYSSKKKVAQ